MGDDSFPMVSMPKASTSSTVSSLSNILTLYIGVFFMVGLGLDIVLILRLMCVLISHPSFFAKLLLMKLLSDPPSRRDTASTRFCWPDLSTFNWDKSSVLLSVSSNPLVVKDDVEPLLDVKLFCLTW